MHGTGGCPGGEPLHLVLLRSRAEAWHKPTPNCAHTGRHQNSYLHRIQLHTFPCTVLIMLPHLEGHAAHSFWPAHTLHSLSNCWCPVCRSVLSPSQVQSANHSQRTTSHAWHPAGKENNDLRSKRPPSTTNKTSPLTQPFPHVPDPTPTAGRLWPPPAPSAGPPT